MKNANPVSRWWRLGLVLALMLVQAGCSRGETAKPEAPKTVRDFFTVQVGGQAVRLQLAVLLPEMERGLMGRRELGPDEGMIFIYTRPQQMSFWMHDTPLPLNIGFFDAAGTLKETYEMLPFDEVPIRSHGRDLQFALEMNQGWYLRHGVRPGAKLDLKALVEALRARGFDPGKFGL